MKIAGNLNYFQNQIFYCVQNTYFLKLNIVHNTIIINIKKTKKISLKRDVCIYKNMLCIKLSQCFFCFFVNRKTN